MQIFGVLAEEYYPTGSQVDLSRSLLRQFGCEVVAIECELYTLPSVNDPGEENMFLEVKKTI